MTDHTRAHESTDDQRAVAAIAALPVLPPAPEADARARRIALAEFRRVHGHEGDALPWTAPDLLRFAALCGFMGIYLVWAFSSAAALVQ